MRIAIVDDEKKDRDVVSQYLERFAQEYSLTWRVDLFENAERLLEENIHYDILFLDVKMTGMSGLEAARRVYASNRGTSFVFISNIAQYAIHGYEVDAVDYLLKPIGYEEFRLKTQKALQRVARHQERHIIIRSPEECRSVVVSDIRYVEVISHYLVYHTQEGGFKTRGSMKECEAELAPYHFTRIHRAYLVNLAHIETIRGMNVIVEKNALPIGQLYLSRLMQDFLDYAKG